MQKNEHLDNDKLENEHISTSTALDDEQRVKVLSPGMLVAKRFFRNKLAMVGSGILIVMFLFSFLGGAITPYKEDQKFHRTEAILKDYAGVALNKEYQVVTKEDVEFSSSANSKLILAISKGMDSFEVDDQSYSLIKEGEEVYSIAGLEKIAEVITLRGQHSFTEVGDVALTDDIKTAYANAVSSNDTVFEVEGVTYKIEKSGRTFNLSKVGKIGIASKHVYSPAASDQTLGYDFTYAADMALLNGASSFELDGKTYSIALDATMGYAVISVDGGDFALVSDYKVSAVNKNNFLPIDFKIALETAARNKETTVTISLDGEEKEYTILDKNGQYTVRVASFTEMMDTFASPSKKHWLGTDGNGMDILTRLMYGGRISLMIGFVAIGIELIIGILVGGLAGYFGGWLDTLLMRVVDVVICIPALPVYIIIGSIMDYKQLDPRLRIYLLCVILGILGWTGIARMVRGQILSLREQEFMIATEATGVRVSRRIFRHLVPNVIPQLIVMATMGLGDIIIMEATLSFLGLGVKFPYASWGNIVTAVNDSFVLRTYWFVWIPAGLLVLLSVLGFNFVGDGLRDSFDPKMKR